jgi:hypothetical protein
MIVVIMYENLFCPYEQCLQIMNTNFEGIFFIFASYKWDFIVMLLDIAIK